MPTIHSPVKFTGRTYIGPLVLDFRDGVTEIEESALNDGIRRYLAENGYGVDTDANPPAEPAAHADPREHASATRINELRDAAVDPRPSDFLPPVNAGQANPHGPAVVAPGIHAADGPKPIHPGPVGRGGTGDEPSVVKDIDAQAANESALAEAVLVDGQPVGDATRAAAANADQVNTDQPEAGPFDPASHTVKQVNAYLEKATADEQQRVLDAEAAGQARAGIVTGPHAAQ